MDEVVPAVETAGQAGTREQHWLAEGCLRFLVGKVCVMVRARDCYVKQ